MLKPPNGLPFGGFNITAKAKYGNNK